MKNLVEITLLLDVLEEFPALMSLHDTDYRVCWANKASRDKKGLSLKEMKGVKCYKLKGYSKPCRNCPVTEVFKSGQPSTAEVLQSEEKSPLEAHNSWFIEASPIKDSDGNIMGAINIAHDITDYRKTKNQLQKKEEFVLGIVETSQDIIWASNLAGTFIYSNVALEKTLGCTRDELIGKSYSEFIHPEDLVKRENEIPSLIREKRGWRNSTVRWKHKDGTWRELESSAVPILDSRGDVIGFRGVDRDVTERNQLTAQLLHAQKMESVGRLAGGIAHDFNNMLGVILGYSEIALGKMNPSQELGDALTEIQNAAKRSANLTRQLLAFARKQIVEPRVLDLNTTVVDIYKMLQRLIGTDIHLSWIPEKELWPVKVDSSQIDQILANLCVNARDAIEGVGKITIKTKNYIVDKAHCVDKTGLIPGEYVTLSVIDTGSGIDKEIMNNMFEPFSTTKSRDKGTGLGLSTVYGIVKQNNGFVYASSKPGEHTTFRVYLPRYSGEIEPNKENNKSVRTQTGTETVLLVEDEEAILKLVKLFLENLGYTVTAEGSSRRALQIFRENPDRFHLLVTDMVMPEMSGHDLWNELQAINSELKCLFMSAYSSGDILGRIKLEKDEHFLQKPFSQKEFATKVREALEVDQEGPAK